MNSANDIKSNNTNCFSTKKSAIISHLKKYSLQQKIEKPINKKDKYLELFRKIVKQYVLFFEFSVMKTAVKAMTKNKWKKLYRGIKFLSFSKINWEIFYQDITLLNKIRIYHSERRKLTLKNKYLSFYVGIRKRKFIQDYNNYLINKYWEKWVNITKIKKRINAEIFKYIDECSNYYFHDIYIKSIIMVQRWFRNLQFFKKLDNIYDLEKSASAFQNETKYQYKFGSFDLIIKEQPIVPLYFYNQSLLSQKNVYEKEINEFSTAIIKETELSINDLLEFNDNINFKNLFQYKFSGDENQVEEKVRENQNKKFFSRSKKNEVINHQLSPIKLKIGCSFKKVLYVKDSIQPLSNFTIPPKIKSPNDILIIAKTEILPESKEPNFIFYQTRYRTPLPDYDLTSNYFSPRRTVQSPKKKKSNIKKQIFYSPKKINPNKIAQYNKEKNEKGISAEVCTLGEYLISNLNIDIPLRFSDLLTEENLNIHDFEITYDPVMKQGIDDEIEIIFQNVTFIPHLSFRKFIQNNIENASYFLRYFRYIPYHLSKHQKRKLTEIIEPLLYSIMFGNISTVLSANYTNCLAKNDSSDNIQYPTHFYYQSRYRNIIKNYNSNKHQSHRHRHHYSSSQNYRFDQSNYSSNDNKEITESEISGDYISDIENKQSSPYYSSYLNINETDKVFFCDESQISSDDNNFLINDYQPLKFKKKRKKSTY